MNKIDPITLEVVRSALEAGAEDMATSLCKTAYNMMIYEVRDFMTANGIPCTVEKVSKERGALKLLAPEGWFAVVGVRGFSPKYGQLPEYRAYRNAIAAAAARSPSKGKFDKINPQEFKWSE